MMGNATILVTDSDQTVAACIAEALTAEGYTVCCHPYEHFPADLIERVRPDLVIMEQSRANPDVMLLLDQLRRHPIMQTTPVIISTTDSWMPREVAASLQPHNAAMLLKPFEIDQLFERVADALAGWQRGQAKPGLEQRCA